MRAASSEEFSEFFQASWDPGLRAVLAGTGDPQVAEELAAEALPGPGPAWRKVGRAPCPTSVGGADGRVSLAGAVAAAAVTVGVTGALGAGLPRRHPARAPGAPGGVLRDQQPDGTTTLAVSASGLPRPRPRSAGRWPPTASRPWSPTAATTPRLPAPAGFTQVVQIVPHPHAPVRNPARPGRAPPSDAPCGAGDQRLGDAGRDRAQHRVLRRPVASVLGHAHRQGRLLVHHDAAHYAAARQRDPRLAVSLTARPGRRPGTAGSARAGLDVMPGGAGLPALPRRALRGEPGR